MTRETILELEIIAGLEREENPDAVTLPEDDFDKEKETLEDDSQS